MRIELSGSAKKDLINIRKYTLNSWGQKQANDYTASIKKAVKSIADNPEIGIERIDISENVRTLFIKKHTIYYAILQKKIIVFNILGQSMMPTFHTSVFEKPKTWGDFFNKYEQSDIPQDYLSDREQPKISDKE